MGNARRVLFLLVAVRVGIAVSVLAASGSKLPGLPRYRYVALTGDANGFYAAAREFISALARPASLAAALIAAIALILIWRARGRSAPGAIVAAALAISLFLVVPIAQMHPPGAAVVGWPLVWSVLLLPLRAIGQLDPDNAFAVGFFLSLVANAISVVATAFAGWYVSGRRSVGIGAAAILALWPLLIWTVAGSDGWRNSQWTVDSGLALYTEPLSTALMTVALALLLRPSTGTRGFAFAGVLLGFATVTRLSNGLIAVAALTLVAFWRGRSPAGWLAAGGLTAAPVVGAYWPKGYAAQFDNPSSWPRHPFSVDYVASNWRDSLIFGPRALVIIVPLALIGAALLRRRFEVGLLAAWIVPTVLFYSLYRQTWEHPRFLFVTLPPVFILWLSGAVMLLERPLRRSRTRAVETA